MPVCNDCILTSGYQPSCNYVTPGGNSTTLYLIDRCKIESITDSTDYPSELNLIDSITLNDVSDEWFVVNVYDDSLLTSETLGSTQSKFILQSVSFTISQLGNRPNLEDAAMQANQFLDELKFSSGMALMIQDASGIWRLFGESLGLKVEALEKVSGTVNTDLAGSTLTLSRGEQRLARVVAQSYIDTL